MILIYGIISLLYVIFLLGVAYYFNKSYQVSNSNNSHPNFSEEYTILIPFKNEREKINKILSCIDEEALENLIKVVLVDDCSEAFDIKYHPKSFKIEIVTLKLNVGKTLAIKKGLEFVHSHFVCILDADIFWEAGNFKNLVEGNFVEKEQLNVLPFEEEFNELKWLQFEEAAIKGVTYASVACNKPLLMSSAAFFGKKSTIELSINNFNNPNGWDMYLLKASNNNLHWIFPNQNRILKTKAENTYLNYVKQRARWVNNSFRNPSINLFFIGLLIFISFSLDLIIFFSFFFLPLQSFLYLISIFVIKTLSSYIVVKRIQKPFNNLTQITQIILSHLIYGLNIGIILIFLVLWQNKERK